MMGLFIVLVVVGVGVSATTPPREPPGQYPITPIKCGPNSHFNKYSKICPPQNCSFLIDSHWLCENPGCKPECRCNDGFYRNENGTCISRDECLAQCGPLERYVAHSSDCQRTCANYKVTAPRSLCKPYSGCVCEEGRVRLNDDATGPCVLPKDCKPRPCPLREHWNDCPNVCANETCISKNPNYKCLLPAIPLPCKGRCMCDKGYLRNQFGDCVPETHCPIKECPMNEVWRCASMCPRDSCKRLEHGYQCPQGIISVCIPACTCKDGYLRNDDGYCIPSGLCPASLRCGINEVAVECQAYPPQTCESVYTLYKPIEDPPCNPGCDCRPGYLRNKRNICVPSDYCPTVPHYQCGPNQEYKKCGSSCEPSCSDLDNPPQVCPDVCIEGCFCKDGYFKDDRGNCVLRHQCPLPICNKPHEVAKDCGSYCEMRTCEDYNRTDIVCPAVCVRGCFCREGYVRNPYGICIRIEKCPSKPVCLQEHEEYQSCGSSCPDNCDNYMNPGRICTMQCVAGCNCKPGYVRNLKDGTCIKPEQCPTKECTGVNEELNYCASYCPVTCANRYTQGDWSCITLCREACDCVPGTLRNDSGACVPANQCTPPICRENEKYMKCGTACPITCDNYKNYSKICTHQCIEDCFCKDGYVRNRYGRCVKPEQCEPTCPTGEKWNECSAHCQDTCENYNSSNRICTYQCQSGCVCEQGTVRRKDGQCVRPTECTDTITCPVDEVYDSCSAHCEPTCENHRPDRACTAICKPGCKCGEGLVRRKDGKCVKLYQCQPTCPLSEHYDECNAHCEDTCELHGTNVTCLPYCNAGCMCNKGLVRRKDGQCVKLQECSDLICPANEEYDPCVTPVCPPGMICAQGCRPGCKCKDGYARNKEGQCVNNDLCPANEVHDPCIMSPCPPGKACIQVCRPGCRCKNGLVRDKNGKCVNPKCPKNERWVECVLGLCIALSCDQLGFPIACPGINGPCDGGCVCAENYVRDSDNVCIPKQNCASCNNDFNATSGCGIHCGRQCTDYRNPPNCAVPMPCQYNGCDCKKGYVYDIVIDRCVDPVDCPVPCKGDIYAEKVKCPNPCPATCTRPTTAICSRACLKEGCQCRSSYVLGPDGKCVRPENCPSNLECNGDPNSQISSCVSLCEPTCGESPRFCPASCRLGCACKSGYILSKPGGICIKPDKCVNATTTTTTSNTNVTTNDDQHATTGGQHNTNSSSTINKPCPDRNAFRKKCASHESCRATCAVPNARICPKICIINGCECKKGYVLSEPKGKCIKIEDCPKGNVSCNGDPNAEIMAFPPPCPSTCKTPNGIPGCLLIGLDVGCQCKPGYLKDDNGKCILPDNCKGGNPCGANEIFAWCKVDCPNNYCPVDDSQGIIICDPIYPCPSGCVCKLNHKRKSREDNKCILSSDCRMENFINHDDGKQAYLPCVARINCTRPNEEWNSCPSACLRENCEDVNNQPTTCNTLVLNCDPKCICKKGYFRNATDICVPAKDCPDTIICPVDEVYDSCSAHCEPTCENYGPDRACTAICKPGCKCGEGLVRRKDGKCVKLYQCPPTCPAGEKWSPCSAHCQDTCENYNSSNRACTRQCQPGCVCEQGTVRRKDGQCVRPTECTDTIICPVDEVYDSCSAHCEPTCENYGPDRACTAICKPGCKCGEGLVRRKDGKCVKLYQCPPTCPAGEKWSPCSAHCQDTCENYNSSNRACTRQCQPGCVCEQDTVRRKDGQCVRPTECTDTIICPVDEVYDSCSAHCEPTCENYGPDRACTAICKPGCKCGEGLVRRKDGKCVKLYQCPPTCPAGEKWSPCSAHCQDTCENYNSSNRACTRQCQPGCVCEQGTVRRKDGQCVRPTECTINKPCPDRNAFRKKCASHESCRATCAMPNARICPKICVINGCECKKGYVLSEPKGKCIKIEDCPKGNVSCNGDPNAEIMAFPPPCPSTCKTPNGIPGCLLIGLDVGCQCKHGYLKDDNGKCILPDNCKGGNPCGANATFFGCSMDCPNNYCPVDDSRGIIACDPPYPCPSGCVCNLNHRRKSREDDKCILSSDCPRIKCTRPNEVWHSCPSACLRENCEDVNNQPTTCNTLVFNCDPKCICKKGYFRNETDICVPAKDCPQNKPCDDPYAKRMECAPAPSCQSTCATPNPSPCIEICAINQCVCKEGYVLSMKNGKCIPVDQCPKDVPCNGDSNAVIKANPIPCPSTCSAPNASPWCKRWAPPVGCECKPGYLLNDDGKCINPDQCPGGNPCGQNATFVPCNFGCPTNNCPVGNTTAIVACSPPYPCPSGCACKKGYKRRSSSDDTCILLSDCPPPIKCKANEVYNSCHMNCPPQTCESIYTSYSCQNATKCEPGCDCISEYLRNGTENDPCIPSDQCPTVPPACGINEHYETNSNKCELTCKNYHLEPVMGPCQPTSACFCDDGYVKNSNGLCIPKKRCPQNITCPRNEVLSECYNSCHMTCKTRLRSDGRMCQLACIETGCLCKEGYLRHDNGTCVPISQCSAPRCNDDETYSKCGTACPPTCQNRGDNCTACTDQCVEDCFCNKGLVRSDDGSCIKPNCCPRRICGANEMFESCPPTCPPTDGCSNLWSKFNCTNAIKCCKPQCRCKPGYLRKDNVCVPSKQCLN